MKKIMAAAALQWSGNGIYILVLKSKTASKMSVKIRQDLQEGLDIKVLYAATF